jgi:hypothetical protein
MARRPIFNIHPSWQDWVAILLGVLIATSWAVGLSRNWLGCPVITAPMWNAILVGFVVCWLNGIELLDLHRWEEVGEIACGVWLIASPYVFNYSHTGMLPYAHFVLGAAVVLLAAIELWQDWNFSDQQLSQRGAE